MKFHQSIHGSNIILSENDTVASRNLPETTFCDAIVFSSEPISFNRPIKLMVRSTISKWRGCLSLGLTTKNPLNFNKNPHLVNNNLANSSVSNSNVLNTIGNDGTLPQFAVPIGLANLENVWVKQVPSEWSQCTINVIVTHNLSHVQLCILFNNEYQVPFIHYLPVESMFWLVLDIFGQTDFVKICLPNEEQIQNYFIMPNLNNNNLEPKEQISNDSENKFTEKEKKTFHVPSNVLLLGPSAVNEYKKCCYQSSILQNSGRIFLIGPSDSGKSLLKKMLLGTRKENKKQILDISNKCYSDCKGNWSLENFCLNYDEELTDEKLYENLAYNLAKMVLIQKNKEFSTESNESEESDEKKKLINESYSNLTRFIKNALKFSLKSNRSTTSQFDDITESEDSSSQDMIPKKIKNLFSEMLLKQDKILDEINEVPEKNCTGEASAYTIWDFSGNFMYFLLNQIMLSTYAVYILVIDISQELDALINSPNHSLIQAETRKSDFNTINILNYWLSVIYSHVGEPTISLNDDQLDKQSEINNSSFKFAQSVSIPQSSLDGNLITSPKIIIVGTHRNSVHSEPITRDQMIAETFSKIKSNLKNKPYYALIEPDFVALDCAQMSFDEPAIIDQLKIRIDKLFLEQNLTNITIPYAWFEFENLIQKLVKRGIHFIDFSQLAELVKTQVDDNCFYNNLLNLQMALNYYHMQGKIFCFNTVYQGFSIESLIVLDLNWFINCFYKLCDFVNQIKINNEEALISGVLREEMLNKIWSDLIDQKLILIGCIEKLDFLCELKPYISLEDPSEITANILQSKVYIFPWITQILPEAIHEIGLLYDVNENNSFTFVIDFGLFLPIGLYTRLIVRMSRWAWNQGWGRRPEICHSEARVAVDFDHDLILKIYLKKHRINLTIIKIYDNMHAESEDVLHSDSPSPNVCLRVRHLIESEMEFIQNVYYRRISWNLKVICPCELKCVQHDESNCTNEDCLHFLPWTNA